MTQNQKWWGWGDPAKSFHLDNRPSFWPYLHERLGQSEFPQTPAPTQADFVLPPSRLDEQAAASLAALLGPDGFSMADDDRLRYAYGKSYRDLLRLRQGQVERAPDGVAYPSTHEQVEALLNWATSHNVSVVPFGGGTSVVGGVETWGDRPSVTLSLLRFNQVLQIDERSLTARIQAGMLGPDLEKALQAKGYTLGHYPQSFEFSTLGGWIATRSAGQQSTRYGKIEKLVVSMRVATPSGTLETLETPASAAGPDLDQVLLGSEGTLGVITEAVVRLHRLPEQRDYRAIFFPSWAAGTEAIRQIMQSDITPATVRLSDPEETQALFKLRESTPSQFQQTLSKAMRWYLTSVRKAPLATGCLLMIGFEGHRASVESDRAAAARLCTRLEGVELGPGLGQAWYRSRFELPYLRDTLMDRGILVDTLETATSWRNLIPLYEQVTKALQQAIAADGLKGIVFCHVSHPYPDGASLYFTMIAPQQPGREMEQWLGYKKAATTAISEHGGTLSHHHGVGIDHRPWMGLEAGPQGTLLLRGLKSAIDPAGLLNPGKLLPPPP